MKLIVHWLQVVWDSAPESRQIIAWKLSCSSCHRIPQTKDSEPCARINISVYMAVTLTLPSQNELSRTKD